MNDVFARTDYPHHAKLSIRTYLTPRFAQVYHLVRCPMEQISAFTTHLNESYDFVRKHMLQQIKQQQKQQQPLYKRTQQDHRRKSSHTNTANNVDKSDRRLGRNDKHLMNVSDVEKETSVWMSRNHVRFFRDRKSLVCEKTLILFSYKISRYLIFLTVLQHFIISHLTLCHFQD